MRLLLWKLTACLLGPRFSDNCFLVPLFITSGEKNLPANASQRLEAPIRKSEKGVREVFRKARQAAPCVIFFDEIDAVAPRRKSGGADSQVTERIVSQFLTEMDGLEELKSVLVLGATKRPDIIDEALLRPGRFDRILEVPQPNKEGRAEIL